MLYNTILYYTTLYSLTLYYTKLYYTILYSTLLYYIILNYTMPYYTILYYTILYYAILYYTILYYNILYCTILYYLILYYSIFQNYHAYMHFISAQNFLGLVSFFWIPFLKLIYFSGGTICILLFVPTQCFTLITCYTGLRLYSSCFISFILFGGGEGE